MTPIPVASAFAKIRAAVVNRLAFHIKVIAVFKLVIRRLDRMQYVFDDVMKRSNDMNETLDRLSSRLKGMGETLDYTGKLPRVLGEPLDAMDETFDGLVKRVSALEEKVKVMDEKITDLICGRASFCCIVLQRFPDRIFSNGVWPVRLYNHQCSLDFPLEWPLASHPPYPAGRPRTLADLQSMDGKCALEC
jgi:hypothetical protein